MESIPFDEIPSDFERPTLHVTIDSLEQHFASEVGRARAPLRNPHREQGVSEEIRRSARPSAVLIPIIERGPELSLLLTRRSQEISYAGHICFPGGRRDAEDENVQRTALRETQEEIGLHPDRVRLLGRLGDYVTHTGYHIASIVGVVNEPLALTPDPREVEEIVEIPLAYVLRSDSYRLAQRDEQSRFAIHFLEYEGVMVTGPTISLMIGFYEELVKTHAVDSGCE